MGIDGIGKPPSPIGAPDVGGPAGAGGTAPSGEPFRVDKPGVVESPERVDPLSRLERGEIGVDQYLNARVEEAVSHLHGKLAPDQLDFVKNTLREQLQTDPVLLELVRRATGTGLQQSK